MIDLTTIFAKKQVRPLRFRSRQNVNYLHEVIFLSSYLHDAVLVVRDLTFTNGILQMPVYRTCWEYWTRLDRDCSRLRVCHSVLKFSGVRSMKWSRKRLPKSVGILSVFVGEDYFVKERAHLVLLFSGRKLRLDLRGGEQFCDFELNDSETPK